jgi:Uma2 family endonuclease
MNEMLKQKRMTVDEFIPWAIAQSGGRYELLDGEVMMMSPEKARHWRTKASVYTALAAAVKRAGLPCEAVPDGATVRINERTAYEPDALVYCGPPVASDAVMVVDPVLVVEVSSPRTSQIDTGAKFVGYFSLPSVRHYLIVDAEKRAIIHHARGEDGRIISTSHTEGVLALDPPGIEVPVAEMLPVE